MSVSITWKIERRIIYVDFSGTVSIEEIEKASQTVVQYIREGQSPVHVIADMFSVDYYPREFGRLVGAIPNLAEVNLGKTILIGNNSSANGLNSAADNARSTNDKAAKIVIVRLLNAPVTEGRLAVRGLVASKRRSASRLTAKASVRAEAIATVTNFSG